jgi:hypothetical protein
MKDVPTQYSQIYTICGTRPFKSWIENIILIPSHNNYTVF